MLTRFSWWIYNFGSCKLLKTRRIYHSVFARKEVTYSRYGWMVERMHRQMYKNHLILMKLIIRLIVKANC